jgi:outer membrane protein OmpA-like peptidoglycan-associated protein
MSLKVNFFYLISVIVLLFSLPANAQRGSENFDCTYSKGIVIPFTYSESGNTPVVPLLDQTVFYNFREQFSYWYKLIVRENITIRFRISALNDSDSYSVYMYQYNLGDVCEKVYDQKIKPLKGSFFAAKNSDDPYDLSEKVFNAVKGNIYYISVLNTSLTNCGHRLKLVAKDTLKVTALHLPCKRDVSTIQPGSTASPAKKKDSSIVSNTVRPKEPVIITPEVVQELKTPESNKAVLVCTVKDSKPGIVFASNLFVTEPENKDVIEAMQTAPSGCTYEVEKGKKYIVKCSMLGYKPCEKNVEISQEKTTCELILEPLKARDNFIMKHIYFYANTYALKKESSDELEKLLNFLKQNESTRIEIQGHTNGDNRIFRNKAYKSLGDEWNFQGSTQKLSHKRAEAIVKYLADNGISPDRLVPKGYGGSKPIIKDPETNQEAQVNIRVVVMILQN